MNRMSNHLKNQFEQQVRRVMDAGRAAGLAAAVINQRGEFLYEGYFGYRDQEKKLPVDRDTIFGLASVTKSFTSLSILQLAEAGIVDLDDPVSRYLPSFTGKNQAEPVRLRHLLCHSGGYFPLPRILIDQIAGQVGAVESRDGDFAYLSSIAEEGGRQVAERLDAQTRLIGRPGERFSYCNDGYALLSEIIRIHGDCSSFAEYLEKHILEPLGMMRSSCSFVKPAQDKNASILYSWQDDGSLRADRDYHNEAFALNGGGAMKSTVSDLAKYVGMYLNRGTGFNGAKIASRYSVREMCKPRQYAAPDVYYCYGLEESKIGPFLAHGHGGSLPGVSSNILWSDDGEVGVIILCNTMDVSVGYLAKAALRMYYGEEPEATKPEYPVCHWTKDWIEQISGEYRSGEGDAFALYEKNGVLGMRLNGKELSPVAVSPEKALVRKPFGDTCLQIFSDETRGVWGAQYGSRIFPRCI
ncbi:MAG: beta-lactamase family protein [Oscillospiraceae bacterium]|jgi:CubicO group peptidase (beta-lactamase class C family)|nr:beta-lactamase family protein [Oscillospiraceae bacterium]